jgi:hypothetical protein
MAVILSLPPEIEQKLRERAARAGQSVERYIQQLVETDVLSTNGEQPAPRSPVQPFDVPSSRSPEERLATVRREFEKSGMSDEELASLVEEIREEIWQEKQSRKHP